MAAVETDFAPPLFAKNLMIFRERQDSRSLFAKIGNFREIQDSRSLKMRFSARLHGLGLFLPGRAKIKQPSV
jgi:hypothetical protein